MTPARGAGGRDPVARVLRPLRRRAQRRPHERADSCNSLLLAARRRPARPPVRRAPRVAPRSAPSFPGRSRRRSPVLGPAILPPFFIALGGARSMHGRAPGAVRRSRAARSRSSARSSSSAACSSRSSCCSSAAPWPPCPSGAVGGGALLARAARRLPPRRAPAVLPAVLGARRSSFVLAWTDFTVPDVPGLHASGRRLADARLRDGDPAAVEAARHTTGRRDGRCPSCW